MPELHEVFGISTSIPKYTYVNRAGLDERFSYLLGSDRHIVIYGPSKQGKTILRKKVLPEERCVVVPCRPDWTVENLYQEMLRQLGSSLTVTQRSVNVVGATLEGEGKGKAGIPFVVSGEVKASAAGKFEHTSETVVKPAAGEATFVFIMEAAKESGRRIIIEDFHYLPEEQRRRLAFDLKAFWDAGVFFIIVGVWAEQNLLTVYNNDLSSRVEEIDVQWSDPDLDAVLSKGENTLNLIFDDTIRQAMIADCNQNVGLLQRLAESVCYESGLLKNQRETVLLDRGGVIDECRHRICIEQEKRYHTFLDMVGKGFKDPERTKLKMYKHLVRVCVESQDAELLAGIDRQSLLTRIQKYEPDANLNVLSAALTPLNRLQVERGIAPLVLYYNDIARSVSLVDRELLFYRRYSKRSWPWEQPGYDMDDLPPEHDSSVPRQNPNDTRGRPIPARPASKRFSVCSISSSLS
jgi:hypothetical protein